MNINEAFPSKYLKAADLQGQMVKVKIRDVLVEEIGSDRKLIMYFEAKSKGMVLNKTNARTIGEVLGDDTDNWIGSVIELFAMKVPYEGRMVDGIRIRIPTPPRVPAQAAIAPNARAREEAPPFDDGFADSEVPF